MSDGSAITIGGLFALLFGSIIIMGILQPIMTIGGVYDPIHNSTTPAGNYITNIYGANGLYNYTNATTKTLVVLPLAAAANQTTNAISPSSLAQTSGFAFVAGGLTIFWNSLTRFPGLIYTMFLTSLSYQGFSILLPYDLAALLSVTMFGYVFAILALKLISMVTKPGQDIANM